MNAMKTLRLGFLIGAAMLASLGVASAQQQVLKVGYAPFGAPAQSLPNATTTNYKTLDPTGAMAEGAYIDLMNAIAKDAGLKIQYVAAAVGDYNPSGTGTQIPLKDGGTVDISLGSGGPASPNAVLFDFGTPIYNNGDCLIVLKSDTKQYKTWDDLKGEVVGIQRGQPQDGPVQASGLFKDVKVFDSGLALDTAVSTGQVKAGLCGSVVPESYGVTHQNAALGLQVVPTYQMKYPIQASIAVRKGNTQLLNTLNTSLGKLKADGTLKAIFTKYGLDATLVK